MKRAVGIVRVSQVNGREGESFASPGQQRTRIEEFCEREGMQLVDVQPEMNVSGTAKLENRAGLLLAIEAIESGQADLVIAAYFDRLVRSLRVQAEVVERVEAAGGEVVAIDIGKVTRANATKKLQGNLLGSFAEYQADTARERSGDAQAAAIARGVCPWPNVAPGYRRGDDGVLVIEPKEAKLIRQAFKMRADGATIKKVWQWLDTKGIERSWHGVQHMLKSRVYLGEIVFGEQSNLTAHEPLVDADLWSRAQSTLPPRQRKHSDRLLARLGVLKCGTCGARMSVGHQRQNGRQYPFYRCNPSSKCPDRMAISAEIAERVVVDAVTEAMSGVQGKASATSRSREAERELAAANDALDNAIRSLAGLMDRPASQETIERLSAAQEIAEERLNRVGRASTATLSIEDFPTLRLEGQRRIVRATVQSAIVGPGRGADRITVSLVE